MTAPRSENARSQLDASEGRYRALFEALEAAVLLMRDNACVACNPAALRLFRLKRPEELFGKTPLDFAPERQPDGRLSADVVLENVALAVKNGTHLFEWESRRSDGEPFTMEVRFTPFVEGGEHLFQCIALDITERKRTEEALRQSEARFRTIFEHAATGIVVVDVETRRFRYANPEVCRMLGYSEAELRGLDITNIHPPDIAAFVIEEFGRHSRGGSVEVRVPLRHKDGTVFEAAIRSVRFELEGRPAMLGFVRDVTAEARMQEDRLRSQKLDAIGVLAGGIAHDFNNVLQGLMSTLGAAQVCEDRATRADLLEQAQSGLRIATGLTSQLVTFSRGGAPAKRAIELGPALAATTRLALAGSPVELQLELPDGLWSVEADEAQLAQVVQNMVLNARQAMPGGGTVRVCARNVSAERAAGLGLAEGAWVVIDFEDTGAGIAEQHLPRIFDPWFTTKDQGSGLGLAVSYSIVKSHGGRIDVHSTQGRGTTFTVALPAIPHLRPSAPPAPARARAARILVMDDDEFVRLSVRALLRSMGHEVDCAPEGASAVEAYRAARQAGLPYEVVILDLTVRDGLGGVETIERLRREDPAVRAVVSSGYSDEPVVADYERYGFSGVLPKPYTVQDLERELDALLR